MRSKMKLLLSAVLAAALVLPLPACGKKDSRPDAQPDAPEPIVGDVDGAGYLNDGMTLTLPMGMPELVLVDMPQEDKDGILFTVSERESVDAGAADGHDASWGDGWLFSIARIGENALHERLCYDMSGAAVFAKDANGGYYMLYRPTDVRLYRQDDQYQDSMEQWAELNEWVDTSLRDKFIEDNSALEAFRRGNGMLDMYLARAAYHNGENYYVSSLEYGPMAPGGVNAAYYAEQLMDGNGVTYVDADSADSPDGEYIVLDFPDDGVRFDFFPGAERGKENYVRTVWGDGMETLQRAIFEDDTIKAGDVMQAWYDALVAANGAMPFGAATDDLLGVWAEKTTGRGTINITRAGAAAQCDVEIEWHDSAAKRAFWEMTATPVDGEDALRYENARHYIRTYTSETEYTDAEQYANGTGTFRLNDAGELVWEDDAEHMGDDTVFINVDRRVTAIGE